MALFPFYDFLGSGSSDDSNDEDQSNNDNDSDWSVDSEKIRKKRKIFDREQKKRLRKFNIGRKDNPESIFMSERERGVKIICTVYTVFLTRNFIFL